MNKPLNSYLQLLIYLKQYEGDGQLHPIEDVLTMEKKQKQAIWSELAKEKFIVLLGGHNSSAVYFSGGKEFGGNYIPAKAKITIQGSKYLKDELELIDSGKYNIHIGDNSTANLIMHSPGATINNKTEILQKAQEIIKAVESDNSLEPAIRNEAINSLNQLVIDVENDNSSPSTINRVLSIGSNISSIGSLVIALYQLIKPMLK